MISNKNIVDRANALITAGSLTDIQFTQLSSVDVSLTNALPTVATVSALPPANNYEGVAYFVQSENVPYFSDGTFWRKNFTSTLGPDKSISTAYAWGRNAQGPGTLGDGTSTNRTTGPVLVAGSITNWKQLTGGYVHSLGVTTTGIAYGWGNNGNGQLGDGTTLNRLSPVTVVGGITNWKQVSCAAFGHSLGVTTAGIAYGWGTSNAGALGDGTTTARSSPVTVVGGITNWSQVSTGAGHSLGVTATGIAYGWGTNGNGRVGDGTTSAKSSPVTVVGGITNWSQLAAGGYHSLGVTATGIAYGWGYNGAGRLGDNTTSNRSSPVTVVGGITNWSQVATKGDCNHSLGVTATGIAYGWGPNGNGRLGDGTTTNRSSPVTVVGGITNWSQLSVGGQHSLGITSTGIAYGWGYNSYGRVGDGTTTTRSSPVTVAGGFTSWAQVDAGQHHSLGIVYTATKGFE